MERPGLVIAAIGAGLVGCVAAVYGQTLGFDFVALDDPAYVTGNPAVRTGLGWETLRWAFGTSYQGTWQPLTWISYMLDHERVGLDPGGYHAVNVLLHALCSLFVFAAFRSLTGTTWRSAGVAALFALHPQHVESVAWVAERKGLLAACFGLLSLWAYASWARRGGAARYLACALGLGLGLLSKQVVVTLPCVFLLLDLWPLQRWHEAPGRRVLEKLPLFALCVAASGMALVVQEEGGGRALAEILTLPQRVSNAVVSYVVYLLHALWPAGLAAFYPHPYVSTTGGLPWGGGRVAAASALLILLTLAALRGARSHPYARIGWFWFLGMSVPTLGLVPFGTHGMADRFSYLPMLGIYLVAVWGVADLASRFAVPRPALAGVAIAVLAALGAASWQQTRHWRDSESLFLHTLSLQPRAAMIHYNYANILKRRGQIDPAVEHFRAALEVHPRYLKARYNLANTLRDHAEPEAALAEYQILVQQYPDYALAHYYAGVLAASLDRTEEAHTHLERALRLDPDSRRAREALNALGTHSVPESPVRAGGGGPR